MPRPTQAEAEAAVRVLLEWAGDDLNREGLDTPARVARSYRELFAGYDADPHDSMSPMRFRTSWRPNTGMTLRGELRFRLIFLAFLAD